MLSIRSSGSFKRTEDFLRRLTRGEVYSLLSRYGDDGVAALASATPIDTGLAAESWTYEVSNKGGKYTIAWSNTDMAGTVPTVILLQYGHGTGTGGYVAGRDFINPAIRPIFDRIAADMWKVVKSA